MRVAPASMVTVLLTAVRLAAAAPAAVRPISVTDLLAMARVSDPHLSPDGARALYTVTIPDTAANRNASAVWLVTVGSGESRPLTSSGRDSGARWAPDGHRIAFVSSRDGVPAVYLLDVDRPGDARRLTALSGGADTIVWSPDGRLIAFTSEVYPDCRDDACNAKREDAAAKNPVQARIIDALLYRHWTSWIGAKRTHLFVVPSSGGTPRDLIPGADYDTPPREREGPHPIAFAPDSRTLCFTAVTDRVEATSTNGDLFEISVDGGTPRRLTVNTGFDGAPAYSPDGRLIAYRSQARAGYESDRWRLMIYDRAAGTSRPVAADFDRSVESMAWAPAGASIFFNAEDRGAMPIFVTAASGGVPRPITAGRYDGEFDVAGGTTVVSTRSSIATPAELYAVGTGIGSARQLTHHNDPRLATLDLPEPERFTFRGAGGTPIEGMLIRPPHFDASMRYPVLLLLHGGPQTQWSDAWSYRWNSELFAAPGRVVVLINRRGSTGFGQKFTDEITGDWGGKPVEDVMKGLDYVLATYPFTDARRVGAAGASYGGYLIDWLEAHAQGRFRVLVSHAGVYDLTSMYGATEELWFPEHDFGGPPWSNPAAYQTLSPHTYAARFGRFKTPTLVIAGEQDFRVPYTQSLEFFTALQRQEVPSRLIVFPDEGHWIVKPQNSAFWYQQVLDWIARYLT
jgi:dipeptidyl aminopeptidase/acylaminoacyl peptidase